MRKLLQEDECAPDACKAFAEEFGKIVGMEEIHFMRIANRTMVLGVVRYSLNGYILELDPSDPYYVLYKEDSDA